MSLEFVSNVDIEILNPFTLQAGGKKVGVICITNLSLGQTKTSKTYGIAKGLYDGAEYDIKIWEQYIVNQIHLDTEKVYVVTLTPNDYQGKTTYIIEAVHSQGYKGMTPLDFIKKLDCDFYWGKFMNKLDSLSTAYKEGILSIIDEKISSSFKYTPAARSHHDNILGGLLNHTLKMVEILETFIKIFNMEARRDFLITCAIFHDIGKILALDPAKMDYTKKGSVMTHNALGVMFATTRRSLFLKFLTSDQFDILLGVIENHHGHEFKGTPSTLEAYMIFHADYSDSTITNLRQFIESKQQAGLGGQQHWFDKGYLWVEEAKSD